MRILAVDLSGLWHVAWHATGDRAVNEAYQRVLDQVRRYASDYDRVAICVDTKPYKRCEIYPEYKANRPTHEPAMVEQLERLTRRLEQDGYTVFGAPGYEADDIIATVAAMACNIDDPESTGQHVVILSQDKDLCQLVNDEAGVALLNPRDGKMYYYDDVCSRLGVRPGQVADMLALMGDSSDNIPGVPGIGPKTAAKLLSEHGRVQDVLAASAQDRVPGNIGKAIAMHIQEVQTARKLVRLMDDAPIDIDRLYAEPRPQPIAEAEPLEAEFEDEQGQEPQRKPQLSSSEQPRAERSEPAETTAIVRAPSEWSMQLEPKDMRQAHWLAAQLINARIGCAGTPETALAVVMAGREFGIGAVSSLMNFHIVEGRLALGAHLIIGLVKKSPHCEYFQLLESSEERAVYETKRRDEPRPTRMEWTIAMAESAGYLAPSRSGKPKPWHTRPAAMLRKTCGVELARAVYPDVTSGLYDPDEELT